MASLADAANPLAKQLQIAKEQAEAEENGYLGAVVRLLLTDDELKKRLAKKASAHYPEKARKALERVLGPLPPTEPDYVPFRSDLAAE